MTDPATLHAWADDVEEAAKRLQELGGKPILCNLLSKRAGEIRAHAVRSAVLCGGNYGAYRCTFQSSEAAARALWRELKGS